MLGHRKSAKEFAAKLDGAKISGSSGGHLLFKPTPATLLVCNLGNTGQLRRAQAKDPVTDATHVVITFTQAGQLLPRPEGDGRAVRHHARRARRGPELAELG